MHRIVIVIIVAWIALLGLGASGCKNVECGPGTIDRGGTCQPADETTGTAKCGPFTELQGDQCVPTFPPTVCDPASTSADVDQGTGVTTCIGTGGGGCSSAFACPAPAPGKQTICGQLYNFTDNTKFALVGATGAKCAAGMTGPCALQILAFDAIAFGNDPMNTPPLPTGAVYIDDCGRYRVPDITVPGNPYIALGIDDAGMPLGPAGETVTTGVAVPKVADTKVKDLEAWIVDNTTTSLWTSTGGPMLSVGIYAAIFRAHMCDMTTGMCTGDGFANQAGVTITKSGTPVPPDDYYFQAELPHQHIDMNANSTSINGTALLVNASVNDSLAYSGNGGIADPANCQWETHAAASLPGIVFMQVYRPTAKPLHSCTQ